MTLILRGPTVLEARSKVPIIYGDVAVNRIVCPPEGTSMELVFTLQPRQEKKEVDKVDKGETANKNTE